MTTVLRLNLYMSLPDTFEGSLSEALGLFLRIREESKDLPMPESVSTECDNSSFFFNQRYGCSVVADEGIWRLQDRKWQNLLEKPDCCIAKGDNWVK